MQLRIMIPFLICALSACGYTFQGGGSVLPPDIKNVYVPTIENNTTEAGLAQTITESVRDQFERFGVLTVVDDSRAADAVLKLRLLRVQRSTRSSTASTDTALQYDATLVMSGELRRVGGAVLWREKDFKVSNAVATTSDTVVTSSSDFAQGGLGAADLAGLDSREISRGQEQQVFAQLADEAARYVYDSAVAPDF